MPTSNRRLLQSACDHLGLELARKYIAQLDFIYAEAELAKPNLGQSEDLHTRRDILFMGAGTALGAIAGNGLASALFDRAEDNGGAKLVGTAAGGGIGLFSTGKAVAKSRRGIQDGQLMVNRMIENSFNAALSDAENAAAGHSPNYMNDKMVSYLDRKIDVTAPRLIAMAENHPRAELFVPEDDGTPVSVQQLAEVISDLVIQKSSVLVQVADREI